MSCSIVLNKQSVKSLVSAWLSNESNINYVGFSSKRSDSVAIIRMKTPGVLAGIPFVDAIFKESNCNVDWYITEGQMIDVYSKHVATVTGATEDLLFCENIVLSILSRASGIASLVRRLKQSLSNTSWKGDLRMPRSLTPGFDLVEEYAMMLAGITANKSSITVRQSHVQAAGGIQKVVQSIRGKVGSNRTIEVECMNSNQAMEAAKAGADLIYSDNLPLKEMSTIATNVKSSFPKIAVQFNGVFDDSDVKSYALSSFDFLSTTKLCNGYNSISFQISYDENKVNPHENNEVDQVAMKSPPPVQSKPKSPDPEPIVEVDSSTAPKKSRLADSEGDSPKLSNSNDAVSARNSNPPISVSNWSPSANAVNAQNQMSKRAQRNQRNPLHVPPQRQNTIRNQSPGGMQFLQGGSPRMINNSLPATRSPAMLQQPLNLGVLVSSPSAPGMRAPLAQQQQQRPQSNMMGAAQTLGGGFMPNMQSQGSQQQSNWQMLPGGGNTGPLVGGLGLGMRLSGPGNLNTNSCRSCGTLNGPGMAFCRNCRLSLR